jgi:hypothetical protein
MQIIAKRDFISTKAGLGNIVRGRIVDIDEGYAKTLIASGLAEEYSAGPSYKGGPSSFISPVTVENQSGPSLQVARVLPERIATKYNRGAKGKKTAK